MPSAAAPDLAVRTIVAAALLILSCSSLALPQIVPGACPAGCSGHGTCVPSPPRCDCPLARIGPDCASKRVNFTICKTYSHRPDTCTARNHTLCFNACHGKGTCNGGLCVCDPGYWGIDCAVSLDAQGKPQLLAWQGYKERQHGPKVYVYELPPQWNAWTYIARVDRPLLHVLMQRLLASGARTADGDAADYYLIPFLMRSKRDHDALLEDALAYIAEHWPWWGRAGGAARHLLVVQGDQGRAGLTSHLQNLTSSLVVLQSWGLIANHTTGRWPAAHRPGQDIVIPSLSNPDEVLAFSTLHPAVPKRRRRGRLFFSGRFCGDRRLPQHGKGCVNDTRPYYSGNTRQQVFTHHSQRSGFLLRANASHRLMSNYQYCLAPSGFGYGRRSVHAAVMGCIPVTVTDHVLQPFEPEMPWSDWSVPVRERDIPRMHEVLDAITPQQLKQMQAKLHCAAQHMYYSSTFGSLFGEEGRYDAVETLLQILRVRAANPGLPPGQYMAKDEHFRKFINCELGEDGANGPQPRVALCNQNRVIAPGSWPAGDCPALYNSTRILHKDMRIFFSWPGGAACARTAETAAGVAACPRAWS